MNKREKLLSPLVTPALHLPNRIVMAPMSRRRAVQGIPGENAVTYYAQRAGAGLIIAENTAVAANGNGYLHVPGIYNDTQIAAWKRVTDAVHARNGKIFVQLVHTGRIGHPLNQEGTAPLVAPSAVQAAETVRVPGDLHLPVPVPEVLTTAGAAAHITAHIQAARNAMAAGFDGVEIHGAHGFLPEQFLHPHTNRRTDRYGGSIAHRSRFLLEIMEGVSAAIGKERTGIRLSPFATLNDLPAYPEEAATHQYIADALQQMDIAYIHLSDQSSNGLPPIPASFVQDLRKRFRNLLILAGGYTPDTAEATLQAGLADLIGFGRPFIANPDLVARIRHNAPLSEADKDTFYQGGNTGYIDYPAIYPHTHADTLLAD
ncbi:alkene reductase [Chitinophaga nivalis]|uniref:Alkene reductase n=1 Tax=Chitinophaga nivalis TaxID=2991709 RepID=A0ABT3II07_9BACT|nr:alkene reductase [Chitinophaga nivalis]MCW3466711.1 alkene reductase [Chitinophaga nivalis]MCW3483598.1 alkene reductase [Chitinophaga nivalis]